MKIKLFKKNKNKIVSVKGLISKSFIFPKKKPNNLYIEKNFRIVQEIFNSDEKSKAFLYTIMHIFNTNILDKTLKQEMLKIMIYDYLEQFLSEEKILLLQSNIVKDIKNNQ